MLCPFSNVTSFEHSADVGRCGGWRGGRGARGELSSEAFHYYFACVPFLPFLIYLCGPPCRPHTRPPDHPDLVRDTTESYGSNELPKHSCRCRSTHAPISKKVCCIYTSTEICNKVLLPMWLLFRILLGSCSSICGRVVPIRSRLRKFKTANFGVCEMPASKCRWQASCQIL